MRSSRHNRRKCSQNGERGSGLIALSNSGDRVEGRAMTKSRHTDIDQAVRAQWGQGAIDYVPMSVAGSSRLARSVQGHRPEKEPNRA